MTDPGIGCSPFLIFALLVVSVVFGGSLFLLPADVVVTQAGSIVP